MAQDDIPQTGSRWDVLSRTFGLVRASGDLTRDLDEHKRVGLQRGFAVQSVKRVAADSEGSEVFEFIASSGGDVKRDGNAVLNGSSNWTLDNFRMNPRFTWNHSYDTLPLGTVVDVRPEGTGQSAILRSFHRFSKRWDFAEIVKGMYLDGDLDCVSIGWTPLEYERILGQDGKPEGWRFTLNELLEIAAVVIPADPKARLVGIQRKLQRGLIPESFVEYLSLDRYLREIAHGDIYVLDHRSPLASSTRHEVDMKTDDAKTPEAVEPAAETTAAPAVEAVEPKPETVAADATVAGRAVRSEMSDAVDIELAKVAGLYESLEKEVESMVGCGKMLPYATDGNDYGMARCLNVARALVAEIDGCFSAIADAMAQAPASTDPYPRPVVVEAPEVETEDGGAMEMAGPAGETRVGKKISKTRMAKLKEAMQYASDAYRCVRAVVADAADGELDGKIAEGEDPVMEVEPMADPTKEQAIDDAVIETRAADEPSAVEATVDEPTADENDAAKLRAVFASLVETAGVKKAQPATEDDLSALAAKVAESARSAKAYADAVVGDLRRKR